MNAVEQYREDHGYTFTELCKKLGFTVKYYHMLRTGYRPVSYKICFKIQEATNREILAEEVGPELYW